MEYTSIYRNGKPAYFFIKAESEKDFEFLQPYFLLTSFDKKRLGNILEMGCLFSGAVWYGRQRHGYGYSSSHDVYGQLINAVKKLHRGRLSDAAEKELNGINTHGNILRLSDQLLDELKELNKAALYKKYNIDE